MKKGLICVIAVMLFALIFAVSCKSSPVYYNVTFVTNGGSDVPSQQVVAGDCVTYFEPVKEDNVFVAWYTDKELTNKYDFTRIVEHDLVLYAKWSQPFIVFTGNGMFNIATATGSKTWNGVIEYSTDMETWNTWKGNAINSNSDFKLYLRGYGNTNITGESHVCWVIDDGWVVKTSLEEVKVRVACSGNIMTLLNYKAPGTSLAGTEGCFYNLFMGCEALTSAPDLPATILGNGCYTGMFYGCTNLKSISVGFTGWYSGYYTGYWVCGVGVGGTFTCPKELVANEVRVGDDGIPFGWTVGSETVVGLKYDYCNGGANVPIEYYTKGSDIVLTHMPSYAGHAFMGFNTKADGSGTSYNIYDVITIEHDTTLYAQWKAVLPVGGTIFYNDISKGGSYGFCDEDYTLLPIDMSKTTLYNASTNPYSAIGNTNIKYYYVDTPANGDRFYVFENTLGTYNDGLVSGKEWGAYGTLVASSSPGYVSEGTGFTYSGAPLYFPTANSVNVAPMLTAVGTGKLNTAECLRTIETTPDVVYAHPKVFVSNSVSYDSIWKWLRDDVNGNSDVDCDDWFIPSPGELEQLRQSGIKPEWFNLDQEYKSIWTSCEYDMLKSYGWYRSIWSSNTSWSYYSRTYPYRVIAVRAF